MGIRRERLRRKTASGTYDTIHLETSADIVLLSDGSGLLEDELAKVKPIEKGGTGSSTADEAMWSLINGCETLDKAEAGDWFFLLDKDAQTVKKISLEELKKFSGGSGGSEEPEEPVKPEHDWPDQSQLTLGNTISWAGYDWIVSHVTTSRVCLTAAKCQGTCTFNNLSTMAYQFERKLTTEQRECLTREGVFVASYDQMSGGLSYFRNGSHWPKDGTYWCRGYETMDNGLQYVYYINGPRGTMSSVDRDTALGDGVASPAKHGFRPSLWIDMTIYG